MTDTVTAESINTDRENGLVALPEDMVAEFVREQVKLDCEITVSAPEGATIDEWEHIDRAGVEYAEYDDGDLMVAFESETTLQRRTARATRHHPAEYAHDDARVLISVVWDLDPATLPDVHIEVLPE